MDISRFLPRRSAAQVRSDDPAGRRVTVSEADLRDVLVVLDDLIALLELAGSYDDVQGQLAARRVEDVRAVRDRLRDPADDFVGMEYGRGEWLASWLPVLNDRNLTARLRQLRRQNRAAYAALRAVQADAVVDLARQRTTRRPPGRRDS